MTRVNVSLPDDLYESARASRPKIVVSRVLKEALARELERRKPLDQVEGISDELVKRLTAEKNDYESHSFDMGHRTAFDWVTTATYPRLRHWGCYKSRDRGQLERLRTPPIAFAHDLYETNENVGSNYSDEVVREQYPIFRHVDIEWDDHQGYPVFSFNFGDRYCFNLGFLNAVRQIWETVEPRLGTEPLNE